MNSRQNTTSEKLECDLANRCGGCDWIEHAYTSQREMKIKDLASRLSALNIRSPDMEWREVAAGGFRTRTDLTIAKGTEGQQICGFYERGHGDLLDVRNCPQMSEALARAFEEFRKLEFSIRKGSARLRVSPSGRYGVWLDFANLDVKALLEERSTLSRLLDKFVVEIGQRRKRLVWQGDQLKLVDPVLENWFETYDAAGTPHPLYCAAGSFTQPGWDSNRVLLREVFKLVGKVSPQKILEYGCGIGNFTVPLALSGAEVKVLEVDSLALAGLVMSLQENGVRDRVTELTPHAVDDALAQAELLLVDPPRSGLGPFCGRLSAAGGPSHILYISCFPESFAGDVHAMTQKGYALADLSIVDQFPQTHHYEIVALLSRSILRDI